MVIFLFELIGLTWTPSHIQQNFCVFQILKCSRLDLTDLLENFPSNGSTSNCRKKDISDRSPHFLLLLRAVLAFLLWLFWYSFLKKKSSTKVTKTCKILRYQLFSLFLDAVHSFNHLSFDLPSLFMIWDLNYCISWMVEQVLVTGSLHLVGDMLRLLKKWGWGSGVSSELAQEKWVGSLMIEVQHAASPAIFLFIWFMHCLCSSWELCIFIHDSCTIVYLSSDHYFNVTITYDSCTIVYRSSDHYFNITLELLKHSLEITAIGAAHPHWGLIKLSIDIQMDT